MNDKQSLKSTWYTELKACHLPPLKKYNNARKTNKVLSNSLNNWFVKFGKKMFASFRSLMFPER